MKVLKKVFTYIYKYLFPLHFIVYWKVFKVVFIHLVHKLLFILAKCHSQFDLHLLSFSSTGSTLISCTMSSFPPSVATKGVPGFSSKNFNLGWRQSLLSFFLSVQISLPYKKWFIYWRLCVAQYVSGASTHIIRSLQLH